MSLRAYCLPKQHVGGSLHQSTERQTASTIISTNQPFAQWQDIFSNAASVVTLIDRLTHQAEIIQIDRESYRLNESRDSAGKRLCRCTELKRPKKS